MIVPARNPLLYSAIAPVEVMYWPAVLHVVQAVEGPPLSTQLPQVLEQAIHSLWEVARLAYEMNVFAGH